MSSSPPSHNLLRRFEIEFRDADRTAHRFIADSVFEIDQELQLDLVGVEIELRLKRGELPVPHDYVADFPHLGKRINHVFADVFSEFVATHSPIRERFGEVQSQFGNYEVIREIGRGGMGVIYEAKQNVTGRMVALKIPFFSTSEVASEARVLASLEHPNICKLYDAGTIDGLEYIAMELVLGESLDKLLGMPVRIPTQQAVGIVYALAVAMQTAHQRSVVHFDIKPSNIMFREGLVPVLMDFGLASQPQEQSVNLERGSPAYCSPERLSGDVCSLYAACDIYSLGAVLSEMLSGHRVNERSVQTTGLDARVDGVTAAAGTEIEGRSEVDPWLFDLCAKATAKNPLARFASMGEFAAELSKWLNRGTGSACTARSGRWIDRIRGAAASLRANGLSTVPNRSDRFPGIAGSHERRPVRFASRNNEPTPRKIQSAGADRVLVNVLALSLAMLVVLFVANVRFPISTIDSQPVVPETTTEPIDSAELDVAALPNFTTDN